MSVVERVRHAACDCEDVPVGQWSIASDALTQTLALDQWHRVVAKIVERATRQHRNDVRVLQARRQPRLTVEARYTVGGYRVRRENLHDNLAAETGLFGNEKTRHPTAVELPLDRVG